MKVFKYSCKLQGVVKTTKQKLKKESKLTQIVKNKNMIKVLKQNSDYQIF